MATISDSTISVDINENILGSRTNDATVTNESGKYVFGSITFDDPLMIPRQFWELFDTVKFKQDLQPNMKFKPEMFASEYYGSSDLWWFVLLSNNLTSHTEFNNTWAYRCDRSIINRLKELLEATITMKNTTIELQDLTLYPVKV